MATPNPLKINVGFIINETNGFTRTLDFDIPHIDLESDESVKDLKGQVHFSRTQEGILTEVEASGQTVAQCSRCLKSFKLTLTTEFTELYLFDRNSEEDAELFVPDTGFIDMKPLVRDYLMLDMPISPVHQEDCKGLCPICGADHNETTCDCDTDSIDPRLAKLKDLLDEMSDSNE